MTAIIIVGFNSRNFLPDCLGSIFRSECGKFKVIFVDNCSTDDSLEYIESNFPEVLAIKNKGNYGFAEANNIGIRQAKKIGAKYIMLLNPDTVIDLKCLRILSEKVNDKEILQPLVLLHDGQKTNLINTAGNVVHILGFSYCGSYRQGYQANLSKEKPIALASGAAAFIPMPILDRIGLFDSEFFMYHEDVDLFWRARMAGYDIKLEPAALVWHKYSFSRNMKKMYLAERNRLAFMTKNFQCRTLLLLLPLGLITELAMIAYSLKEGWFSKKLSSYFGYLKLLPHLVACRRRIQKGRKVTDRVLMDRYGSTALKFSEMDIPALNWFNAINNLYWQVIRKVL